MDKKECMDKIRPFPNLVDIKGHTRVFGDQNGTQRRSLYKALPFTRHSLVKKKKRMKMYQKKSHTNGADLRKYVFAG